MKIIEESVVLSGETFTKTEIKEIASYCTLYKDGVNYSVKTSAKIRSSLPMQKALKANLLVVISSTSPILLSSELRQAVELYKG